MPGAQRKLRPIILWLSERRTSRTEAKYINLLGICGGRADHVGSRQVHHLDQVIVPIPNVKTEGGPDSIWGPGLSMHFVVVFTALP